MPGKTVSCYPKFKPRPTQKILHVWDLLALAAAIAVLIHILPLDLSQGLVGSKPRTGQEAAAYVDAVSIPGGYFDSLFSFGNAANGGYFHMPKQAQYRYIYRQTEHGGTYDRYRNGNIRDLKLELSGPGIILGDHLICIEDDDTVFYCNIYSKDACRIDYAWRDAIPMADETHYDYSALTALMARTEDETLTVQEAAMLVGLIQENCLVGYADGVGWFTYVRPDDGGLSLIRAEAAGEWEFYYRFDDLPGTEMVALGRYFLQLREDGTLAVYDMTANYRTDVHLQAHGELQPITAYSFVEGSYDWTVVVCGEGAAATYKVTGNDDGSLNLIDSDTIYYTEHEKADGPVSRIGVDYWLIYFLYDGSWFIS